MSVKLIDRVMQPNFDLRPARELSNARHGKINQVGEISSRQHLSLNHSQLAPGELLN
jgi:hypothetical protein